jgi:hypothetical protein
MAATIAANPIRRMLDLPEYALLTLNTNDPVPAQPQSPFLSVPEELIVVLIELACKRTSCPITLSALICIVNCSATCRALRRACRNVRTEVDSVDFVKMLGPDACEGDRNLNEHRMRIHQMNGGKILRVNRADDRGGDTGEYDSDGISIIIVRDCNPNAMRTADNPFGMVHVAVAAPEAKPCMQLDASNSGWHCISLSLKCGVELLSGHHLNESFAHPLTKWVSRVQKKVRVWKVLGPKDNEEREYMHGEDEREDVEDESVVEVKPVTVNIRDVRGLYFVLAPSGSPKLSNVHFIVPYSVEDQANPIAQFFGSKLDVRDAMCRINGEGEEAACILDSKFTVTRTFTDSMEEVSEANIQPPGKRRASVMRADHVTRRRITEDAHLTSEGFLAPSDRRYGAYAAEASANGWIDAQLANSDASASEFIAIM